MVASNPGKASAWPRRQPSRQPQRPGAASPAGWFHPTGGEAAPPFRHGMEPARSDETAEPPGYARASFGQDGHGYKDPRRTAVHQIPRLWPGPSAAEPRQLPVVGPTEALRGRAGGPGLTAPPGAVPGLLDPEGRSGWQLARQVWAQAGVAWEPVGPVPAAPASPAGPAPAGPAPADLPPIAPSAPSAPSAPLAPSAPVAPFGSAEPAEPAEVRDEPVDEPRVPVKDQDEPVDQRDEPVADEGGGPAEPAREESARPDPGANGRIRRPARGWSQYPTGGYPGQSWPTRGTGQVSIPPLAFAAMPLGAPVAVEQEAPWSAETAALPRRAPATRPLGEPDALFRAWQGSVRQAADPRGRWTAPWPGQATRRHRRAWRAVTIGVPAAVIVTVGAGALLMLTGKANEMLAVRGDTGTLAPGASASASASASGSMPGGQAPGGIRGATGVTGVVLTGYPGQHGAAAADSIWSAAGVSLAVGDADGHPAVWRQSGGSWTLVSAGVLRAVPGTGTLTAVAHGPAGWIAVGLTTRGGSTYPLVLASVDGLTWQPVAALTGAIGSGAELLGVAAGPDGYAVVGRQMIGGRIFASLWWSADMRMWVQGANGGLDGRLTASTANAAAATATGFVAVGSHGAIAAIWTSPDGAHWDPHNLSAPSGARSATLRQVVARGNIIVATGFAVTGAGDIPLAVASADGGAHWRSVILPAPGGLGVVTALTAKGSTLIAAGQAGPASARQLVTWTSTDGLHWSAAAAVSGVRQLSALAVSGGTLTGPGSSTAQPGTNPAIMTSPAP
jgi:hypothetical protein